ncbi:MAG TPA: ATP-binding protein [Candidatus Dormibacteraeota bacterium]|nr:ATP-binding protein [Candidatus Dormibacteraeota bacterium]
MSPAPLDPTDLRDLQRLVVRTFRPPIRDIRFWIVEGLVAAIAVAHLTLLRSPDPFIPTFVPVALYSVPVVYAALNFGLAGALATAGLVVVMTVPTFLLASGGEVIWAESLELWTILLIAGIVGDRVEREVSARTTAELSEDLISRSEAQFRTLFELCPAPILLVSEQGAVTAANPVAAQVFGRTRARLMECTLADLVGSIPEAERILNAGGDFELPGGPEEAPRILQAFVAAWPGRGERRLQLAFLDVSEERRRLGRVDAYAASILAAHEEERRRIAQEVHDEPVQALIHLCRRLDMVADDVSLPDPARAALAELRKLAQEINDELRRLARGLRPPALDDLGLLAAIRRLLSEFEDRTGIRISLDVEGANRRLDPALELGLFRIAQEAIRNVERHSQAQIVAMRVRFTDHQVEIEIKDDGIGFSPLASADQRGHLGLIGMQERATLLGGTITIEARPGRGTQVVAAVPVGVSVQSSHF